MVDALDGVKNWFFDRQRVLVKANKAKLRQMSKFGAYVRTRSSRSLRRRKKPSAAGSPPSVHSSSNYATLKNILFSYDPKNDSVVVGPVKLNLRRANRLRSMTVPQLHEFGGTVQVISSKGPRTATYPARPFMKPALLAEAPKFAGLFKGEISE